MSYVDLGRWVGFRVRALQEQAGMSWRFGRLASFANVGEPGAS